MATGRATGPATLPEVVGLLGASGFVGRRVATALSTAGVRVRACSRDPRACTTGHPPAAEQDRFAAAATRVRWHRTGGDVVPVSRWISVCPVWCLPEWLPWLEACGATRLVAISSTSRFTKAGSADAAERDTALRLAAAETAVERWAHGRGVTSTILQPTMIYDGIHDRNVARIAGFIRRFGFFPVVGAAAGLRQPVHVDDVAAACVSAVSTATGASGYVLSGGESLTYRELVVRVFQAVGLPPRFLALPRAGLRPALTLARLIGVHGVTIGMFDRMGEDLVFDHGAAARDLGFHPRPFVLTPADGRSDAGHPRHSSSGEGREPSLPRTAATVPFQTRPADNEPADDGRR